MIKTTLSCVKRIEYTKGEWIFSQRVVETFVCRQKHHWIKIWIFLLVFCFNIFKLFWCNDKNKFLKIKIYFKTNLYYTSNQPYLSLDYLTDHTFPEYFQNACFRQFFEGMRRTRQIFTALQYPKIKWWGTL
jgi:ABC-type microcin C transport system permease subunit YejE